MARQVGWSRRIYMPRRGLVCVSMSLAEYVKLSSIGFDNMRLESKVNISMTEGQSQLQRELSHTCKFSDNSLSNRLRCTRHHADEAIL
jgi:hypothetical protein